MSNNTFTLQNIDKVNFYGTDNGTDVYLEGVSTGTSGVCVSGSLLVNGDYINFGSSLGSGGYGFQNNSGTIQFKHSTGEWSNISGASIAGSNKQVQFNDNGSFGACAGFTFDNSNNSFSVGANNNTVDGINAGNVAGNSNTVSGSNAGNVAGNNNTVSGSNTGILAGNNNSVTGTNTGILAGSNNTVEGVNTGILAGLNNTVEGVRSGNVAGVNNIVNNSNSGNLAGNNNRVSGNQSGNIAGNNSRVSGNQSGNIAGSDNGVSGNYAGNVAGEDNTIATGADYSVIAGGVSNQAYTDMVFVAGGFNNSASGTSSTAIAGKDNTVSGTNAGNVAGESNNVFSNNTVALGGQGLSTQTGTSWEKMTLVGTYNNYSTYPWDESETQTVTGTFYRFLVGSGDSTTRNNAFAVDDVGNLYFGTCAGACIYQRTGLNTYEPINLGGGGGGGGTTSPAGNDTDIQFNDSGSFGGVNALQFHKSTTSGVSALTVNGNVFSNFGVSGLGGTSPGLSPSLDAVFEQITPEEFVNGVYFPQVVTYYNDSGNNRAVYRVRVPNWIGTSGISARFPELANPGFRNSFETTFYGTCTLPVSGSTNTSPVITIMNQGDTVFDNRLFPSGSGTSLTFSLVSDSNISLTNGYGSGVTIKSIVHSSGISMYPVGTVNYRTVEITSGGGGGGGGPSLSTAVIPNGQDTTIILTFDTDVQINGSSSDAPNYFSLTLNSNPYPGNITGASASGTTITLTVDTGFSQGDSVDIDYFGASVPYLQAAGGASDVADFSNQSVTNNLS